MLVLVLDKIHGFDNVGMMEGGGNTKFSGEFLHIFLFRFVLPALAELLKTEKPMSSVTKSNVSDAHLDCVQLLLTPIPLVCQADHAGCTLANRYLLANPILLRQAEGTISCSALGPSSLASVASRIRIGSPG